MATGRFVPIDPGATALRPNPPCGSGPYWQSLRPGLSPLREVVPPPLMDGARRQLAGPTHRGPEGIEAHLCCRSLTAHPNLRSQPSRPSSTLNRRCKSSCSRNCKRACPGKLRPALTMPLSRPFPFTSFRLRLLLGTGAGLARILQQGSSAASAHRSSLSCG